MPMVIGTTPRTTDRYGLRALRRAGPPITMDTGPGSNPGVGPGWMMNPGASRRFTMDAGPMSMTIGAGAPARFQRASIMLRRWSLSSVVEDSAWVSRWAAGAAVS